MMQNPEWSMDQKHWINANIKPPTDQAENLPPMPIPAGQSCVYSATEMRAYAAEAVRAEREACAKVCDAWANKPAASASQQLALDLAADAIRARGTP